MKPTASWHRDQHGIPQILATGIEGLHWGMGYCHAMDRGLQMLLMRILGQGRAAELLRGSDEMVEVDRFFRRMNWSGGVAEEERKLSAEARVVCDAYCRGVNERLKQSVPWELRLAGVRPEPWSIGDTLLLARMTGFLTLAQSQGEVERLFVEMVQAGVSDAHLEGLFPGSTRGLDRASIEKVTLGERIVPDSVKWAASLPRTMASNNWCVSGNRTASGAAMLANDPHLETNRLPNVWAEQSFRWPGGYALLCTMPGLPAPLLGRNEHLSWGATYTFMDAIDSWVEHCREGKHRRGDGWVALHRRVERIERKKGQPIDVTFWESEHGVLDGDASREGYLLATRWSGSFAGARSINALLPMWTARTVEEGMAAFAQVESSFNWVFADRTGNIGYQMSGLMPRRAEDWSGFAPRLGWDERFDWHGFADPDDLPRAYNPERGLMVTANQDLNHLGRVAPINAPMGDYRARRIEQLLSARNDHDVDSFRSIQLDTYSIQAAELMEVLEPLLGPGPLAAALHGWDYRYEPESVGATAFEIFYAKLLVEMFGPECGTAVIECLRDATGTFIDFYQNFDRVLVSESSPWLGDRTRDEVWRAALGRVADQVPEPWGERNRLRLTNVFFGGKLPQFLGFDPGPIPIRGGRATPHQGQIYRSGGRLTSFTPSLRLVADMSEPFLHTALCGGPSDRRLSKWYKSGVEGWLAGTLKKRRPPA
jgi:penicillin amidase